jgi:hypothetical protein
VVTDAPARSRPGRRTPLVAALCALLVLGLTGLAGPAFAGTTGHVSGTLTSSAGGPAGILQVTAESADLSQSDQTFTTGPDGTYSFDLPPGPWRICTTGVDVDTTTWHFLPHCSDDDATTEPVEVSADSTTVLDQVLTRATTVSGSLTASSGADLTRAVPVIYARDSSAPEGWSEYPTEGTMTGSTYTVPLVPDGTYRLCFDVDGPAGCLGAGWVSDATDIPVAGAAVTRDVVLPTRGTLAGTVSDAGGPLGYASVTVLRKVTSQDGTVTWVEAASTTTDSDGTWSEPVLPGSYRLELDAGDGEHATEFYPDAPTAGTGTDVPVSAGTTTTRNVVLGAGGSIEGVVNLPAGDDGVEPVQVLEAGTREQVGETWYAVDGDTYEIDGLPAGSYVIAFASEAGTPSYAAAQLYEGGAAVGLSTGQAVTLGPTTLTAGGSVSGSVVDGRGAPLSYLTVAATAPDGSVVSRTSETDEDGGFTVTGLSDGPYRISVDSGDVPGVQYYAGGAALSPSATSATTVRSGSNLVGLRFGSRLGAVASTTAPKAPSGAPTVGQVLTAAPGDWTPAPTGYSYQWLRDGLPIGAPGASPSRTLVTADANHRISVRVIAAKEGYDDGTAVSAQTAPVDPGPLTNVSPPRVSGAAAVGQRLTADAGAWSWLGGYTAAYQWFSGGATVPGATGSAYVVQPGDLGRQVSVAVTVSGGSQSGSAVSAPTAPVAAAAFAVSRGPAVAGRAKVGKRLSARAPVYAPGGAVVTYQWLRNGSPVARATGSTYKLKRGDRGRRISVRVTLTRPGYASVVLTSGGSGKVKR